MDTKTIEILRKTTNEFYARQCDSFSATRTHAWHGWERCLPVIEGLWKGNSEQNRSSYADPACLVLDLACGNLRFEEFLASRASEVDFSFYAVDNCDELASTGATPSHIEYQSLDVLDVLQQGLSIHKLLSAPLCDLSVSFGFMHHIPTMEYRETILRSLVEQTRCGGYVIVTFWQFLNSEALRKKAEATHEFALWELGLNPNDLDEGDYLLGWKETSGSHRYCHSFSEAEIDDLAAAVEGSAKTVARFAADGKTNDLNTYLILKVK